MSPVSLRRGEDREVDNDLGLMVSLEKLSTEQSLGLLEKK